MNNRIKSYHPEDFLQGEIDDQGPCYVLNFGVDIEANARALVFNASGFIKGSESINRNLRRQEFEPGDTCVVLAYGQFTAYRYYAPGICLIPVKQFQGDNDGLILSNTNGAITVLSKEANQWLTGQLKTEPRFFMSREKIAEARIRLLEKIGVTINNKEIFKESPLRQTDIFNGGFSAWVNIAKWAWCEDSNVYTADLTLDWKNSINKPLVPFIDTTAEFADGVSYGVVSTQLYVVSYDKNKSNKRPFIKSAEQIPFTARERNLYYAERKLQRVFETEMNILPAPYTPEPEEDAILIVCLHPASQVYRPTLNCRQQYSVCMLPTSYFSNTL